MRLEDETDSEIDLRDESKSKDCTNWKAPELILIFQDSYKKSFFLNNLG